jgi:hypothetical protein
LSAEKQRVIEVQRNSVRRRHFAHPQEANQQTRENQETQSASRCAGDHEMATPDTLDRAQRDTTLTLLEGFKTKNNYMNASRCKASMYAQINRDKEAETVILPR